MFINAIKSYYQFRRESCGTSNRQSMERQYLKSLPRDEFCAKNKNNKIRDLESYLKNCDRDFYAITRSFKEIEIYEKNKEIVRQLNAIKHSKHALRADKIFASNALNHAADKDITSYDLEGDYAVYSLINKRQISPYSGDIASKKYFEQDEIKNFNFKSMKKKMVFLPDSRYELLDCYKSFNPDEFKNLSSNDFFIKKYQNNETYDLPYKFYRAAINDKEKYGNAYIKDFIPEIFSNLVLNDVFSAFDTLSVILRRIPHTNRKMLMGGHINFSIGDENFKAECTGAGFEGTVYKITEKKSNKSVILKVYTDPADVSSRGVFGSMVIHREAVRANCSDITKLMLANPLHERVIFDGEGKFAGGWEIDENADEITPRGNKPVVDWFEEYNLYHSDYKPNQIVNGCLVDFGFVMPKINEDNPG